MATDYDELMRVAANALAEAKARGRNCSVLRPVRPPTPSSEPVRPRRRAGKRRINCHLRREALQLLLLLTMLIPTGALLGTPSGVAESGWSVGWELLAGTALGALLVLACGGCCRWRVWDYFLKQEQSGGEED